VTIPITRRPRRSHARWRVAALLAGVSLGAVNAYAVDGTWQGPGSEWTTGSNWSSGVVPDNVATFTTNGPTSISILGQSAPNINTIFFDAAASAYTITNNTILNINGTGIVNTSSNTQTIINNFLIIFKNSSTAGNATIINNSRDEFTGRIWFQDTSTGGQARFILGPGASVDISGLTSGGMTAGSIEGAGTIYLGSKNLTVGSNNLSTTVYSVISDSGLFCPSCIGGSLTKVGTGTLILNGPNTYTGTTTIDSGTLIVNGSIASSHLTVVNNGGVLASGIGTDTGTDPFQPATVGNTQVNFGGSFMPGLNQFGLPLTVAGNLAFQSGALYVVQLNPKLTPPGLDFGAKVTGSASLGGTVVALYQPGSSSQRSFIILEAAGFGGTKFDGVSVPKNFSGTLSYSSFSPTLNFVTLNLIAALGNGTPLNHHQQSIASAINAYFNNGGTLPPGFANLFLLTGSDLANAHTRLSGEAATGAQQGAFQLTNEFLALMLDTFVDGRAGVGGGYGQASAFAAEREPMSEDVALAYARVLGTPVYKAKPFEQRWSIWGGAYGGYNKTRGEPIVVGSHDLSARTAGFAAGMDYRIAPGTVVGLALAGGGTGWSLAQGLGSGRSDAFQAGIYGKTSLGPAYLAAALAYTEHWMSTDRFAFAGDHLTADFNAQSFGGRVETGYRIPTAVVAFTPYAAVQTQNFRTPTYSETDVSGGGFGLTYNARNATDTRSELGARFDKQILVNWNAVLALRGKVAWAHDWITDPTLTPAFQALPGASFIVRGGTPAKDSALTSVGVELRLINGLSLLAKFDGEFAAHSQTYGGTGAVRYTW
jgi:outer membrane autotransporter protein